MTRAKIQYKTMNNHFTDINQVLDAFIIDLIYKSVTHRHETTYRVFHTTPKIQQLLNNNNIEISEMLFTLEECMEDLSTEAVEQMNNLQVWLLESSRNDNKTTLKIGSTSQQLCEYQVSNLTLPIVKLVLFIIPLYHTETWGFFVFHPTEYEIVSSLIEKLINMIDMQSPKTTVKFTKN